jgi:DNA-binding transcriptional regulator YhcF (GntR family)
MTGFEMIKGNWKDANLYQRIAEKIRQSILSGIYQPGDRLPSLRELKEEWHCTQGTIQHAYKELSEQGLVISHFGKGTHVVDQLENEKLQIPAPLRKANLVHRAESFLLESLIVGYSLEEIEESLDLARRHMQTY